MSCDCHVIILVFSYEDQNGRESVIEFFSLIFAKFPDVSDVVVFEMESFISSFPTSLPLFLPPSFPHPSCSPPTLHPTTSTHTPPHHLYEQLLVHRYASFFFIPLSSQLANDDSPTCKRMIAETISFLFRRVSIYMYNRVLSV